MMRGRGLRWLTAIYGAVVVLAWTGALVPSASAHVFAPSLLELREVETGIFDVRWKQPIVKAQGSDLRPILPPSCIGNGLPETYEEGTGLVLAWQIRCADPLVGQSVAVEGIAGSGANVLLRVELFDGRAFRQLLTPDTSSFVVPERQSALAVGADYTRLGIEHILSGWDHLLFVLALVLLVGWGKQLLWTVTAFTVGHSVTLGLAVLGFVHVPQQPVEAAIAFSIYVLGIDLVQRERGRRTTMDRVPWLVAAAFGLLHGLGFAGALTEVGLPQGEIPVSLFAFNVGIEIGQLLFVAVVLAVWAAIRRIPVEWPSWAPYVPAYGIGSVAAFWVFERVAGILPRSV